MRRFEKEIKLILYLYDVMIIEKEAIIYKLSNVIQETPEEINIKIYLNHI